MLILLRICSVPIINLESAMHHPCQSLADMLTIHEKLGAGRKRVILTWAWHPKALPMAVPNSFALAAAQMGHDLVIAHPPGYELDEELMETSSSFAANAGGSLEVTNDIDGAFSGAEVIYAKSWARLSFYSNTVRTHHARTISQQVDRPTSKVWREQITAIHA